MANKYKPHWQDDIPAELIVTGNQGDLGPAAPGEVLAGYLDGPIPRNDEDEPVRVWRLYQNQVLNRYLEVDESAIDSAVRLPEGRSLVRVKPNSVVRSVIAFRAGQGASSYLEGNVGAAHANGVSYGGTDDTPAGTTKQPCSL